MTIQKATIPARPEPDSRTIRQLKEWIAMQAELFNLPLVEWGPAHNHIAALFAEYYARGVARRLLDEALNSGDGSYKP